MMHLVIPDPTPDEPTVPEPSVCQHPAPVNVTTFADPGPRWHCNGCDRILDVLPELTPMELCEVCGQPTETPPLCARHQLENDEGASDGS